MAPLNHALRNTGEAYRVDAHQRSHAVEYQTARCDLLELEEPGLLEKTRQGNAFLFFAPTDLRERLAGLAGMPARAAARHADRGGVVVAERLRTALGRPKPTRPHEAIVKDSMNWTRDRSTIRLEAARREALWPIEEGITESVLDRKDGGQEPTAPASASVR